MAARFNSSEHETFTKVVLDEQEERGKEVMDKEKINEFENQLNSRAQENTDAGNAQDDIIAEAKTMKLFETFLETAPQTVLQLYIVLQQNEQISKIQMTTLVKGFLFFLIGAMKNYLGPTKVHIY